MAVTKETPSIEASIIVNGVALQEYDDDDALTTSRAVTKYVEAVSGAEFAVRCWFDKLPKHDVRVKILLDGKYACDQFAMRSDFQGSSLVKTSEGVKTNEGGMWQLHKYAFSELRTVDSEGGAVGNKLMKEMEDMGQITLELHYIANKRPSTSVAKLPPVGFDSKGVPEKALKGRALSHQSTFHAPQPTRAINIVKIDYLDPKKVPFAVFHFKYRSRNALKALMVIPRSPSPTPLEDRDVDALTPEEMRQLLRRQRERDQAAQAVKQERGLKRERSRERSSTVYNSNGDDDDEVSFVSAKRRQHPVTIGEDGAETIDLT